MEIKLKVACGRKALPHYKIITPKLGKEWAWCRLDDWHILVITHMPATEDTIKRLESWANERDSDNPKEGDLLEISFNAFDLRAVLNSAKSTLAAMKHDAACITVEQQIELSSCKRRRENGYSPSRPIKGIQVVSHPCWGIQARYTLTTRYTPHPTRNAHKLKKLRGEA